MQTPQDDAAQERPADKIRIGIGEQSRQVDKSQRTDGPPAWDLDTKFRHVGKRTPRLDAVAKATGRAVYPSDERPANLLYACILRSSVPAGVVKSINLDKAKKAPGVHGVLAQASVGSRVRYQGQELVAIAATSRDAAESALELVEVEIEATAHNVDPQEGLREEWQPERDDQG